MKPFLDRQKLHTHPPPPHPRALAIEIVFLLLNDSRHMRLSFSSYQYYPSPYKAEDRAQIPVVADNESQ